MKSGPICDSFLVTNLSIENKHLLKLRLFLEKIKPKVELDPQYALATAIIGGGIILPALCLGAIAVTEWLN